MNYNDKNMHTSLIWSPLYLFVLRSVLETSLSYYFLQRVSLLRRALY